MAARHKGFIVVGVLLLVLIGLVQGKAPSCKEKEHKFRQQKQKTEDELKKLPPGVHNHAATMVLKVAEKILSAECGGVKECATNSHTCHTNAKCTDTQFSYKCSCMNGYTGNGESCRDVDECATKRCHANAYCKNTVGSYTCHCKNGYKGDGHRTCKDVDECAAKSQCHANAHCKNTVGSFTCHCKNGYKGDGSKTCIDIDECADPSLNSCPVNTTCVNSPGSFTCSCATGFESTETGKTNGKDITCQDIDECAGTNVILCGENRECENSMGGYQCVCKSGFKSKDNNGTQVCEQVITNVPDDSDIDECADPSLFTCGENSKCKNTPGGYECVCESGYESVSGQGDNNACQDIDECKDPSLHTCKERTTCLNHPGGYNCACAPGYEPVIKGQTKGLDIQCEEKQTQKPCDKKPCHPKATCTNTNSSYKCKCKPGYKGNGKHCQKLWPLLTTGSGMFLKSPIMLLASALLWSLALF